MIDDVHESERNKVKRELRKTLNWKNSYSSAIFDLEIESKTNANNSHRQRKSHMIEMQWESARKVDASNYANHNKLFQLNSIIRRVETWTVLLSVCGKCVSQVVFMKMAFNGCDTDGPHNKRLCTGQNSINVNDNNNNTNGGGLCSNGGDVDMNKGLGLLRVNLRPALHPSPSTNHPKLYTKARKNETW